MKKTKFITLRTDDRLRQRVERAMAKLNEDSLAQLTASGFGYLALDFFCDYVFKDVAGLKLMLLGKRK